jgi:hypothetical protein
MPTNHKPAMARTPSSNPPRKIALPAGARWRSGEGGRAGSLSVFRLVGGSLTASGAAVGSIATRICGAPQFLQKRTPGSTGAPQRWQLGSNSISSYSRGGDGGKRARSRQRKEREDLPRVIGDLLSTDDERLDRVFLSADLHQHQRELGAFAFGSNGDDVLVVLGSDLQFRGIA